MNILHIPENLNLATLINSNNKIPGLTVDKIAFVCDSIYNSIYASSGDKMNYKKESSSFVRLNSKILEHYLGSEYYKSIILWMKNNGIIEVDDSYQSGVRSKGYRFSDTYKYSKIQTWQIQKISFSQKRPLEYFKEQKFPEILKRLSRFYQNLTIDVEVANRINNALYGDVKTTFDNNKLLSNERLIQNFNELTYHSQDDFGYRVHNKITKLPKAFRGSVTYMGQPMAQTDISNSQLFFSIFLFDQKNWELNKSNKHIWNGIGIREYPSPSLPSFMFSDFHKKQSRKGFEIDKFIDLATTGEIYSFLAEKLIDSGFVLPKSYDTVKDYVKKVLIAQICGDRLSIENQRPYIFSDAMTSLDRQARLNPDKTLKNKHLYLGKNKILLDIFENGFPYISELFNYLKKHDYADLSKIMQRIESTAVIEHGCKSILRKLGSIPIFTLHDCIVTTAQHIEIVNEIFIVAISEYMGYTPKTKITYW